MAGPSGGEPSWEHGAGLEASGGRGQEPEGRHSGVVGLKNLHNTCFMNSSLQCLAHTPPLVQPFVSGCYRDDINKCNLLGYKGEVAEAFGQVMEEVWMGRDHYYAPRAFKQAVCNNTCLFEEGRHHDTQEFLGWALDGLHEDLNKAEKKPYRKLDDDPDRTDSHVAQEAWEYYRERNSSLMSDHCTGMYKCTTTCLNCGSVSRRFDPVMTVTLQLPHPATRHFIFTVIEVDGSEAPRRHAVEVDWEGSVEDLYYAVSRTLSVEGADIKAVIYIAVVHGHVVQRTLQKMHESLDRIGFDDELVVYKYPDKEQGPLSGGLETHIQHRKPTTYNLPMAFGTPLVFWVKEENMTDDSYSKKRGALHELLDRALRPYKRRAMEPEGSDTGREAAAGVWDDCQGEDSHQEGAGEGSSGDGAYAWEGIPQRGGADTPGASSTQCACGSEDVEGQEEFCDGQSSGDGDGPRPRRLFVGEEEEGADEGASGMDEKGEEADSSEGCAPSPLCSPLCSGQGVCGRAGASQQCLEGAGLDGGQPADRSDAEASAESACQSTELSEHCSPAAKGEGGGETSVEVTTSAGATGFGEDTAEASGNEVSGHGEQRSFNDPTAVRSAGNGVERGEEATSPHGVFYGPEGKEPCIKSLFDDDDDNLYWPEYRPEQNTAAEHSTSRDALGPHGAYSLRELWSCVSYYSDRNANQENFVLEWTNDHHKFFDLSCLATPDADASVRKAQLAQDQKVDSVGLSRLFEVFQEPTKLSGHNAYSCERCKQQVPAQNCFSIFELPEILVIQIKRFENRGNGEGWERNSMLVDFPMEGLDMSPYVATDEAMEPIYDLYAVLNHYGSVRMGHYTAHCRHFNGKWYHFDDELVTEVNPEAVVSSAAYVLFYRRRADAENDPEDIVSQALKERGERMDAWQTSGQGERAVNNSSSNYGSRDTASNRFPYHSGSSPTCSRYSEGAEGAGRSGAQRGWDGYPLDSSNDHGHVAGSGDSSNGNGCLMPGGDVNKSDDPYSDWNKPASPSYGQNGSFPVWDIASSTDKHWPAAPDVPSGSAEPGAGSDKGDSAQASGGAAGKELVLYNASEQAPNWADGKWHEPVGESKHAGAQGSDSQGSDCSR